MLRRLWTVPCDHGARRTCERTSGDFEGVSARGPLRISDRSRVCLRKTQGPYRGETGSTVAANPAAFGHRTTAVAGRPAVRFDGSSRRPSRRHVGIGSQERCANDRIAGRPFDSPRRPWFDGWTAHQVTVSIKAVPRDHRRHMSSRYRAAVALGASATRRRSSPIPGWDPRARRSRSPGSFHRSRPTTLPAR